MTSGISISDFAVCSVLVAPEEDWGRDSLTSPSIAAPLAIASSDSRGAFSWDEISWDVFSGVLAPLAIGDEYSSPLAGMRIEPPHCGHLPRLPAKKSLTCIGYSQW
jgi:hypothetical protein